MGRKRFISSPKQRLRSRSRADRSPAGPAPQERRRRRNLLAMALKLTTQLPNLHRRRNPFLPTLLHHRPTASSPVVCLERPGGHKGRRRKSGPRLCAIRASSASASANSFRSRPPKDVNVLVTGSTGYIGKFVVRELTRRGFNVIAVARERSGVRGGADKEQTLRDLAGSTVCFSDVTDPDGLNRSLEDQGVAVDVVVCCLASRSGGVKDSWRIDYEASRNSLVAGRGRGAAHFVLLSAICVQKPVLEFQRAKLRFEAELEREAEECPGFTYSIVRPTAFFKSLGAQVESVKGGMPYVMFGDGKLCACKPISEEDLAAFIADCVTDAEKACRILPVGGPGKAVTPLEQGEILFRLAGKEPKFLKVPIGVMDLAIGVLTFLAKLFPAMEDAAEYGRIGRYYAAESMLVFDPETGDYSAEKTPSYGERTLEGFFRRVLTEGMAGQELGEQAIF